jgi:hypothetical protein
MTQTLQIFRKDVRHLAPFISVVIALQAMLALGTVRLVGIANDRGRLGAMLGLCYLLLPFAWTFLVALVVLQDPLVGENSFWLTRPYSWPSLLAAKILFALVFLSLPLFLSDCAVLQELGIPFDLTHLLLRQLPLLALLAAPALALSSISRNVSQFSLFVALFMLILFFEGFAFRSFHVADLVAVLAFPLAALPAAGMHFAKRSAFTRVVLAGLVAIVLPASFFASQLGSGGLFSVPKRSHFKSSADWSRVRLQIDSATSRRLGYWAGIRLPIQVEGLAAGVVLRGDGDTRINSLQKPLHTSLSQTADGSYFLDMDLFDKESLRGNKVSLQTSLEVWVLNDSPTYKVSVGQPALVKIAEVGLCLIDPREIACWSGPVHSVGIQVKSEKPLWPSGNSTFSWEADAYRNDEMTWGFMPLTEQQMPVSVVPGTQLSFTPHFPIARFDTRFSAEALPISNYIDSAHTATTQK